MAPGTVTPGVATRRPPARRSSRAWPRAPRVEIRNERLHGSLALTGGRIDNIVLADYQVSTAPGAPDVALLNPPGAPDTYFVEFGWVPAEQGVAVPGPDTVWQASSAELRPDQPVTLSWDNGAGAALRARDRDRRRLPDQRHPAGREHRRGGGRRCGPTA